MGDKPKKQEANYHLPTKCCASCKSSSWSSYDTPICTRLAAFEAEVDTGGVCDLYEEG